MNASRSCAFLLILFAFACFVLSPQARATCQQGCDLANGNTFLGDDTLVNNTTGSENTAIGGGALLSNSTGIQNTGVGSGALLFNTTGELNTATGHIALELNSTGSQNTATGESALYNNRRGNFNTATGRQAMQNNVDGSQNTATGFAALFFNTHGNLNTATGYYALISNTTGKRNAADGNAALMNNTTGSDNIALGDEAGRNLTTGDHNIDIGNRGAVAEASTIRTGRVGTQTATYVAGISGATVTDGIGVVVGADGHLGTVVSSERFKEAIKPMDKASEAILALKPVTFRYKKQLDPKGIPQFGLVAEEVEKVNPDLVARDDQGKPYTVRYEAVNAMLLNEFLKEHRKVELQDRTAQEQQKEIDGLKAELKEQKALIQKVSAQLEVSKPALQTVVNNH